MKLLKSIKEMFFPSAETKIRRKSRKKYLEERKNTYDMPEFRSTDFSADSDLDLYVIAFNNLELIKYQIKFVKKFLKGKLLYIVIDNSNKKEISTQIRELCVKENISYFKVYKPKKIRGTYSASHAMAMNWAYANIIKARENSFAFLDHDIYPTKEIHPAKYIEKKALFGSLSISPEFYFLWAGFAFFRWDIVKDKKLNFGRLSNFWGKHIGDSGSANWNVLYKHIKKEDIATVNSRFYDIYKGENVNLSSISYATRLEKTVQYLHNGEWLHLQGASGWHSIGEKNSCGFKLLDELLAKD